MLPLSLILPLRGLPRPGAPGESAAHVVGWPRCMACGTLVDQAHRLCGAAGLHVREDTTSRASVPRTASKMPFE